jgi:hypothetical protein
VNSSRRRLTLAIAAWDLAWRAFAVRRALRNRDRKWLIPLLTLSSAGVLPIVYLAKFGNRPHPAEGAKEAAPGTRSLPT